MVAISCHQHGISGSQPNHITGEFSYLNRITDFEWIPCTEQYTGQIVFDNIAKRKTYSEAKYTCHTKQCSHQRRCIEDL